MAEQEPKETTAANEPEAIAGDISEGHGNHEGVLYVGIDLGTSRSAIAGSNGVQATTP